MALLQALVRSDLRKLTEKDHGIVGAALIDLQEQGYALPEVLKVCRRVRKRVLREGSQ